MVMPTCSNGKDDMFEPVEWNFDDYSKQCQKQWSVTPRPMWPIIQYGGKNITTASNIIFRYEYLPDIETQILVYRYVTHTDVDCKWYPIICQKLSILITMKISFRK